LTLLLHYWHYYYYWDIFHYWHYYWHYYADIIDIITLRHISYYWTPLDIIDDIDTLLISHYAIITLRHIITLIIIHYY
jgi:hypothetical protein